MKNQRLILLIAICLCGLLTKAQTVNVDAALKYWALTDSLKLNIPISDKTWTQFIHMEGNQTYVNSVFDSLSLTNYRKAMEIVYMPKNEAVLQKNLARNVWYCVLIKRYKDREQEFRDQIIAAVTQPGYFNKAYELVYEYLPKKAQHPVQQLNLYYNCLGMDAVSYPNGLFFSLMAVANNRAIKQSSLEAHELHHRLRPAVHFGRVQAEDEGLIWALSAIQNEGIADMIDKYWAYKVPGDPEDIKAWLISPAAKIISTIDSNLVMLAENKTPGLGSKKQYRNLLQATVGHMPGFFMARIIVQNGYKKQLVKTSDDPFEFIFLYNRAAIRDADKPPVFTQKSIAYLKNLQQKSK